MHDKRYLFFKNKLQALWVKNNVLDAMNKEVVKNEVCKKEKESKNFGFFTSKVKNGKYFLEIQQKQKEMELNVEYIRKNKKVLTKEFVDSSALQRKNNNKILNREVFDQENDIIQKLEARKNRAMSLPHQNINPLKVEKMVFHVKGNS